VLRLLLTVRCLDFGMTIGADTRENEGHTVTALLHAVKRARTARGEIIFRK
jgi:hypothetical protein